MTNVT
jgi:SAM-dependent methyltransferase